MIKNKITFSLIILVFLAGFISYTWVENQEQPIYYATGFKLSKPLTNDKLNSEQWALYNDGSFKLKGGNRYILFDNTFDKSKRRWNRSANQLKTQAENINFKNTDKKINAVPGIDINISQAWDLYKSQRNVIVAMIDTGIDYNHEDLFNIMWINQDEIPGNNIDDDGNGYIDDLYGWNFYENNNHVFVGSEDDHGTHGAGTIAATKSNSVGISGIADVDAVSIMSLKVLGGQDGSGTTDSIIKAIEYAESNGAKICNLSLGSTTYDQTLYDVMANSKMLFVVAAGNGDDGGGLNIDYNKLYPASFNLDNIISVANVSCDGNLSGTSNYGEQSVDIAAPGSYILGLTTQNGYAYMSGTSMSAPMVTGVAALIYSGNENFDILDVKRAILSTATPLENLSGKVKSGGMLDAGSALQYSKI